MRGSTGTAPATNGTWHRDRVAWKVQISALSAQRREEGRPSWRSRGGICCVGHLGAHGARQAELSGLRTSAVTPQWVLVPAQGGG